MLLPPFLCLSLVDTAWQLSLSIGRPSSADPAALLGPPLAMFTPGGGRPQPPAWLGREWAGSGSRLSFPLTIEFFDEPLRQPMSDEPLRRTQARRLFTRSERLGTKASGVAWGMLQLSSIEALVVWCIDLPDGVCSSAEGATANDADLPAGTRLYCSTQAWRSDELQRLMPLAERLRRERAGESDRGKRSAIDSRLAKLERALPKPGQATLEAPALGAVTLSAAGQLSVQRAVSGKIFNPFENAGRQPLPSGTALPESSRS
mmetsp:Transcript_45165/g.149729  ORF Transcript_45165/g.149729 Transcript_45165/m.149729 type:complete len:261 (+) Transcript_45165:59-841(+)